MTVWGKVTGVAAGLIMGGPLGGLVGAIAGYDGKWIDAGLMRIAEFFQTLPRFVLALIVDALAPTFGGVKNQMAALKLVAYSMTAAWDGSSRSGC